jgi:hypothetical protein
VFSNAVIEHVGDDAAQVRFVDEMLRVADNVFFTTPNKLFPVESHTNVLFLHWHDERFYRWCARHKPALTPDTLNLLSYRHLQQTLARSRARTFAIARNRVCGLPMTFTVTASDR